MAEIEKEHVHKVYSEIATHFSDTRFKPWPRIAQFLKELPPGSLVADVGCGNGKYFGVNPEVHTVGCDTCPELVSIGYSRGYEVAIADCLHLPYYSNLFDALICIAVIHHLSTEDRRREAIRELARVLRPGGTMLLYVWAMEQEKKKFSSQDVMVPWHLQPKYTKKGSPPSHHTSRTDDKPTKTRPKREKTARKRSGKLIVGGPNGKGDKCTVTVNEKDEGRLVDDKRQPEENDPSAKDLETEGTSSPVSQSHGGCQGDTTKVTQAAFEAGRDPELKAAFNGGRDPVSKRHSAKKLEELGYSVYQRYYHVFKQKELSTLVQEAGGLEVMQEYYDHENWCVLAIKTTTIL